MKFVVDGMLGKLAKWLLILGFDVVFDPRWDDDELLRIAKKENRTLLTRDNGLLERAKAVKSLFIVSEHWKEQVRQVLAEFRLKQNVAPYSRCLECNVAMKSLSKSRARNLVSSFVYEKASSFALCPRCGRVFWQGTHYKAMEKELEGILGKKASARPKARRA